MVFAGRVVDAVGVYFDAADVFLLPGTGGLALNEAMAHGLPLISGYADGSADDLVQDGVNGFRLRQFSSLEISQKLSKLLANTNLKEAMGAASRDLISSRFSFENFIRRVVSVLDAS